MVIVLEVNYVKQIKQEATEKFQKKNEVAISTSLTLVFHIFSHFFANLVKLGLPLGD